MQTPGTHSEESETTSKLFERISLGNPTAFEEVHLLYKSRLAYFLKKILPDWQDVEDVMAETFIALWKNRSRIESDHHLKNFLFITARNRALNIVSSKSRQQKLLDEWADQNFTHDTAENPEMVEAELLYILQQAVKALPATSRKVFELSWDQELSPAEIAQLLDMNPATVRSQKRHAIQLVKEWIKVHAPHLLTLIAFF